MTNRTSLANFFSYKQESYLSDIENEHIKHFEDLMNNLFDHEKGQRKSYVNDKHLVVSQSKHQKYLPPRVHRQCEDTSNDVKRIHIKQVDNKI